MMKLTILLLVVAASFAVSHANLGFLSFLPLPDMDDFKMPDIPKPNKDEIAKLGSDGKSFVQGHYQSQSSSTEMKDGKVVNSSSKSDDLTNDNGKVTEVKKQNGGDQ